MSEREGCCYLVVIILAAASDSNAESIFACVMFRQSLRDSIALSIENENNQMKVWLNGLPPSQTRMYQLNMPDFKEAAVWITIFRQ
jgi:hypothetical protein